MADTVVRSRPTLVEDRKRLKRASKTIKKSARAKRLTKLAGMKSAGKRTKGGKKDWLSKPVRVRKVGKGKSKAGMSRVKGLPTSTRSTGRMRRAASMVPEWNGVQMLPVVSSNVASYGYDEDEGTLYIQFLDGSLYQYDGVEEGIWQLFQTAPSKGKFVWRRIRDMYPYERVYG